MVMHFGFMVESVLKTLDPVLYSGGGKYLNPISLSLYDREHPMVDGAINLGLASELPEQVPAFCRMTSLVCLEDVPIPEAFRDRRSKTLGTIGLPKETKLIDAYRLLNAVFEQETASIQDLIDFAGLSSADVRNSEVLRSAANILGCSVALLSQNARVLGYCTVGEETDENWRLMLEKMYYPNINAINLIKTPQITVFDPHSNMAVISRELFPERGEAFLEIRSSSKYSSLLGYLLVSYTSKAKFCRMMDTMNFIAATLANRLWHNMNASSNRNSIASFMLREILHNSSITDDEIIQQMANIDLKLKGKMYLLVINASSIEDHTKSLAYLITVFSALWPNDIVFTMEADIVAILSGREQTLSDEFFETLDRTLAEHDLYAGISDPFDKIDKTLYNYFCRARAATRVGKVCRIAPRYMQYRRIALLHFIYEGSSFRDLKGLCDPRLLKLTEMDKAKGTDYLYTIRTYWHFSQNIAKTCEFLHIHRNTLFYRLKKIREVLEQDFCNAKNAAALRLSMAILEYTGEVEFVNFPPDNPTEEPE